MREGVPNENTSWHTLSFLHSESLYLPLPQRKESAGETWFVRKHIRERTPWLPVSVCT